MADLELRKYRRRSGDISAVILLDKDRFSDVGIRGIVKNISKKGALVDNVFCININKENIGEMITQAYKAKLILFFQRREIMIDCKIVRTTEEGPENSIGVVFLHMKSSVRRWLGGYLKQ